MSENGVEFLTTTAQLLILAAFPLAAAMLRAAWHAGNADASVTRANNAITYAARCCNTMADDWLTADSEPADELRTTMLALRAAERVKGARHLTLVEDVAA